MQKENLTDVTKQHYETLMSEFGDKYIYHRWGDHPVKRSHYRHTKRSIENVFDTKIGQMEKLLEVGCGPGIWTDIMLQHARQVTLFDISEEMLKVAKQKYRNNTNIDAYVQGDYIADVDKLSGKFDVIFSSRALEYMSDKQKMVTQSHGLLNPGGALIIITKNPDWHDKITEKTTAESDIQTDWVSWKTLAGYYQNAGFKEVTVYPVAQGSYYQPFNNSVGVIASDVLALLRYKKNMHESYNYLSESYLVYGKA